MIVISPHLDDAVFSVGQILAANPGATVATVFAGTPGGGVTPYDESAGFTDSAGAVAARRREDIAALDILGAHPEHGPFLDGQYEPHRTRAEIVDWIRSHTSGHDIVLIPVGVHHPDHLDASAAAKATIEPGQQIWLYEELPYRVFWPDVTYRAIPSWADLQDLPSVSDVELKTAAVEAYASQLNPLLRRCLYVPERTWRIQ